MEIWTRWAGVLCLFSEYNGEPDLLFCLAQVKSTAIGDGHAQLIERTGGKFRYSLAVLVYVLFAYKLMMPFMLRFLSTGIEGAEAVITRIDTSVSWSAP